MYILAIIIPIIILMNLLNYKIQLSKVLNNNALKVNEIKQNIYNRNTAIYQEMIDYGKKNDELLTIDNIKNIETISYEGTKYDIEYENNNMEGNISISFNSNFYYNLFKQADKRFNCDDDNKKCEWLFYSKDENSTYPKTRFKYIEDDFNLDDFLRNTCKANIPVIYDNIFKNDKIENDLRITEIDCSNADENSYNSDTINNLEWNMLYNPIKKIVMTNQDGINNLDFINNLKLDENSTLDFSGDENLTNIDSLDGKTIYYINLSGTNIDTYPKMKVYNIDLSDTSNTDLSNIDFNNTINADLSNVPIDNIDFLKNDNDIKGLDISGTNVSDLSPLEGKNIEKLYLDNSQVTDITPLCDNNTITDFSAGEMEQKCSNDSNFCNLDAIDHNSKWCK